MAYKIKLNKEKCVGCYACYVTCMDAHYDADDQNATSRRSIQKYFDSKKNFEKNVCLGCIHCGKCIEVCPTKAIYKDEKTGFVLVNRELCTGCKKCQEICPYHVIMFEQTGKMVKCDGCIERIQKGQKPACLKVCCPGAITWEEN